MGLNHNDGNAVKKKRKKAKKDGSAPASVEIITDKDECSSEPEGAHAPLKIEKKITKK